MVKVEAIIDFTYSKYDKIKDLKSFSERKDGKIFEGDIFYVNEKEALYLTGKNKNNIVAVKILEIVYENKTKENKNGNNI